MDEPSACSDTGLCLSSSNMRGLSNVLVALNLAKASVTGIGIPGVETVIGAVVELATMVSTMDSNKEDLADLDKRLDALIKVDDLGCGDELKRRLTALTLKLRSISSECKALAGKHKIKRFFKGAEYRKQIEGIRDSITSAIESFTFSGSIAIEKVVAETASKVDKVLAEQILAKVKCVAARYNAENTPDECMEGTRVDIIKEIISRLTSPLNPTERILMLSGAAGSGKSTIAKTIASTLWEDNTLAASFFFSRDLAERQNIRFLSSTLAHQLADHDADFQRVLVNFLDADRNGILAAEPQLQFQKLVVELLAKMTPSQTPWVICLDALDECGKHHGQEVLLWLSKGITQIPTHIRFFLTGRPEVVAYKFDTLQPLMHTIILDDISTLTVGRDIRLYVERSLDGNAWRAQEPWKAQARDVEEIAIRADGLFVFAATAVRYVLEGLPQTHPQSSIDYLLKGAPLEDLNGLYHRIVDDAISLPGRGDLRARDARDRALQILGTLLHLVEPLDLRGLGALLDISVDAIRRTLLPFSAVIQIPDEEARGTIRIFHLSFREFMTSELGICESRPDLLCGTEAQQRFVASHVIRILNTQLKFNICELPSSHLRNTDMPGIQERLDTHLPQHLRYCCRFWAQHLTSTSFNSDIAQEAGNVLRDKFLFWLEVLSLLGMVVESASPALSKFIEWTKDESIVHFATDAQRFIAFFNPAISKSAPHIYLSALALAPVQSVISQRFRAGFPGLLDIPQGRMGEWPATTAVLEGHTSNVYSVAVSPDGKRVISGSGDETIRMWDAQTGQPLGEPLTGDTGEVYSVGFSPDGKQIISGSENETVCVWDAQTGQILRVLTGHAGEVYSVAFSPNGKHIVSGGADESIHLWNVQTGQLLKKFQDHSDSVNSVAFSPDGRYIVSGSDDETVRVWDAQAGHLRTLEGHGGRVCSVAFSPDGKTIVSGSSDDTVCVWDAQTGDPLYDRLKGHTNVVISVAFSWDGKYIVSGSDDGTARMWDAQTGQALGGPFKGHTGWVNSVVFSPDGKHIVSGSDDQRIRIWDTQTGHSLADPLNGHSGEVYSVAFSPNGKHIVSGSDDETVRLWDAHTGHPLRVLKGHEDSVYSVMFSSDSKQIISGAADETVRVWDVETGQLLGEPLDDHTDSVNSIALSPHGEYIVSGSDDETIRVWDAQTRRPVGDPLNSHAGELSSVAFSPDGKHIVSGSDDTIIRLWDAQTGQLLRELRGHTDCVNSVAFSPDGNHVVSGSDDETIRVWDEQTGKPVGAPLARHTGWVGSVAFSPDSKLIVSGSEDETVRIWDAQTGHPLRVLKGHKDCINSIAFSLDGKYIVSGSDDETVRIWDVQTGHRLLVLKGHTDGVASVAFSPDGKQIVSGSQDNTVRVWDAETGHPLRVLKGHEDSVNSVAFSPDNKLIISGADDETVRVWDVETGQLLGEPLDDHTDSVNSIAFSPNGEHIISSSDDKTIRVWDTQTRRPVGDPFNSHAGELYSVAFSPDGAHIVSGSDDETIRVWDTQTGQLLRALKGHTDSVGSVAFSPDGHLIISGSDDNAIRVWDAQTGLPLRALNDHTDSVTSIAFSADSKYFVSGSNDETVRLWDVQTGEPLGDPFNGHTNWVSSVAFSPDGKNVVSGSADNTIRVWHADMDRRPVDVDSGTGISLRSVLPDVSSLWKIQDGWVCCHSSQLLFWLPDQYRSAFRTPYTKFIIGGRPIELSYSNFKHGTEWAKCYDSTADAGYILT